VRYSTDTLSTVRNQVEQVLLPIYAPKQVGDVVCNIPVDTILDSLIKNAGEPSIYIETMAHSIPTRVVLMAMQRALREKKQDHIRVIWK